LPLSLRSPRSFTAISATPKARSSRQSRPRSWPGPRIACLGQWVSRPVGRLGGRPSRPAALILSTDQIWDEHDSSSYWKLLGLITTPVGQTPTGARRPRMVMADDEQIVVRHG
jgi:hypothetical protein